jgi:cytochrome oxidase assembly protein ShyY1
MSKPAASDVLRLALTPRWLVLGAVALGFIVGAILLGRWQWDRTQEILASERAALSQPVAIESVFPAGTPLPPDVPGEQVGRPVIVSGTYEPAMQVFVVNRELKGQPGVWVVTGVRLADGRIAAVLRGWTTEQGDITSHVPPGQVKVTGILQPDEPFYADASNSAGTVAAIAHDALAKTWNAEVLPGYTTLTVQEPPIDAAPAPVPPTVQTSDVAFPLQNFVYAFQWWIFAIFAAAIYLRWLLLEARDAADAADAA